MGNKHTKVHNKFENARANYGLAIQEETKALSNIYSQGQYIDNLIQQQQKLKKQITQSKGYSWERIYVRELLLIEEELNNCNKVFMKYQKDLVQCELNVLIADNKLRKLETN